ncbi:MAG: hypothetical protein R3300_19610, partial [Candidatus Promineifilaceae bacterium]|nr:hypothetical protein [Candidatus Promineifilaceae bacterium]
YFLFWPTADSTTISNLSRVLSFGILLPVMVTGLVLVLRQLAGRWRVGADEMADLRPAYWLLMLLFMVVYTAVHLASWANVRYRLPVDAFLLIFAGYAVDRLLLWWQRRDVAQRALSVDRR